MNARELPQYRLTCGMILRISGDSLTARLVSINCAAAGVGATG